MSTPTTPIRTSIPSVKKSSSRHHIRGSSLLVAGRFLSIVINFVAQIFIVNYLSKAEYGAFAYALSIVALGESLVSLGLDRAVTRFIPIYEEKREYNKLFGTLILVISTIISLSTALILIFYGLQSWNGWSFVSDELAGTLLLIMVFLIPVQAFDVLLINLLAVFAKPGAIFLRKYVLAPGLKLSAVLLLIVLQSDVIFLAGGYLVASILGVTIYTVFSIHLLHKQGLFGNFRMNNINLPIRELFAFTLPLLSSELMYTVMNTADVVMVEYFRSTSEVAGLRVVQPAARMNQLVLYSFAILFMPSAARLFARNDRSEINQMYWNGAIWIAVASFPIFALSFSLAHPFVTFVYGTRYEESAAILALLALGYYFNAALGQNGSMLKVVGRVRYIFVINVGAAAVNIGLNFLLIPRYGALGAAIATCFTLIAHNIFKQAGLYFDTGINVFEWRYFKVYLSIIVGAVSLLVVQMLTTPPVYISFSLAIIVSLAVFLLNRKALDVAGTFPELARLPLIGRFFAE